MIYVIKEINNIRKIKKRIDFAFTHTDLRDYCSHTSFLLTWLMIFLNGAVWTHLADFCNDDFDWL